MSGLKLAGTEVIPVTAKVAMTIEGDDLVVSDFLTPPSRRSRHTANRGVEAEAAAEAEKHICRDDDDRECIRSLHLRHCLTALSDYFTFKGEKRLSKHKVRERILYSVFITPQLIPLQYDERDIVMITIHNPSGASLMFRPNYKKWSLSFEVLLREEQIDAATLRDMFFHISAGLGVGARRGTHQFGVNLGHFRITKWKVLPVEQVTSI